MLSNGDMKSILSLPRTLLLVLSLGAVGTAAVFAAPSPLTPAPVGDPSEKAASAATKPAPSSNALTKEEYGKLSKARNNVLAANPELKAEGDNIKLKGQDLKTQGAAASAEDKTALKLASQAYEKHLREAMMAYDPTLAPIYAKIDAAAAAKKKK